MQYRYTLPHRIVVGLSTTEADDGGVEIAPLDRRVLDQALWLAEKAGAAVRIVHALDEPDVRVPGQLTTLHQFVADQIAPELEQITETAARRGVAATHVFRKGKPWLELLREAKEWDAEMVMLGARRTEERTIDDLLHGSNTRRVLHKAPLPVWVVAPGDADGIERILVPVDLTEISSKLIAVAEALFGISEAERVLVHSVEYPADIALRRLAESESEIQRYHETVRAEARQEIDKLLAAGRDDWVVHLLEDWVVRAVPEICERLDIDLVVLGGHSRAGIAAWVLGSQAEKLADRIETSSLYLKPDEMEWPPVDEA